MRNIETIGPRALLLRYLDLHIENVLRGWKIGQNRGKIQRILTPNESILTFRGATLLCTVSSKLNKKIRP